ncbi:MAG: hypothetical protein KF843_08735 [Flavobacteriales bacterium]|nr:hypothetical protein [Flavobacteriales bacterium]
MRGWLPFLFLLLCGASQAQRPHLEVPPQGSPDRVQLFGTVTDSITGKPVYDCLVEYYDMAGERLSISSVNSDGQYAMYVPAHLPFELRIERENGYRDLRTSAPQIPEGTGQFRLDLVLHPK